MDALPDDLLRTISSYFSSQDIITCSLTTTIWNQLLTMAVKFSHWKLQPLCDFFPRTPPYEQLIELKNTLQNWRCNTCTMNLNDWYTGICHTCHSIDNNQYHDDLRSFLLKEFTNINEFPID